MKNVAILMTVHNRRDKTLQCLDTIQKEFASPKSFSIKIFLTDDGSTDNTTLAIQEKNILFPYKYYRVMVHFLGMVE